MPIVTVALRKSRMSHPSNSESGIVYVIKDEKSGLHKIGITLDWRRRSRQLDIGTKTRAICVVRTIKPGKVETALHLKYKALRLPQSEWFNLEEKHMEEIKQILIAEREIYKKIITSRSKPRSPKPYSFSKLSNKEASNNSQVGQSQSNPSTTVNHNPSSDETKDSSQQSTKDKTKQRNTSNANEYETWLQTQGKSASTQQSQAKSARKSNSNETGLILLFSIGFGFCIFFSTAGNPFMAIFVAIFTIVTILISI